MSKRDSQEKDHAWKVYFSLLLATTVPFYLDFTKQASFAEVYLAQTREQQTNFIYVNPNIGDDSQGNGSERSPLKTISQALVVAQEKTVILLSPGTYSEETGEKFPIILSKEVTIQGSPASQGVNTIIKGNGAFISPTSAGQNVTIAAIQEATGLTGVTVINPHRRGHGLWIESASPEVTNNTFTRNGNSGVSVNGNSYPKIYQNYFFNNGGNGLLIYGTSQPEVKNNIFEKTGFGVSIVQTAKPVLISNRITSNRVGVILEGSSQAILRQNLIENSSEDGLVIISKANVDLGTSAEAGANTFRGNHHLDIKNASTNLITAFGNQISGNSQGKIDFGRNIVSQKLSSGNVENKKITYAPESRKLPTSHTSSQSSVVVNSLQPPQTSNDTTAIAIPVLPPPKNPQASPPQKTVVSQNNLGTNSEDAIEIPVQPAPKKTKTMANADTYKVVVNVANLSQEAQVQLLYPDAFNTVYNGRPVLQVGVFSNRDKAEQALINLKNIGLTAIMIES